MTIHRTHSTSPVERQRSRTGVLASLEVAGAMAVLCGFCLCAQAAGSDAGSATGGPAAGPGFVVQSAFGGRIFGFDIDQSGDEGLISEAQDLPNGNVLAAVETFDQRTGEIVKVLAKTETQDDFVTLGVVGTSVGLVEREHVVRPLRVKRSFRTLDPLEGNQVTGVWEPPIERDHIVTQVSRSQGATDAAVFVEDLSGSFEPLVFSSDVAANSFGPLIKITDPNFTFASDPLIAFDSRTNDAILAHATLGQPFGPPTLALVDLTTGSFKKLRGVGAGDVNGIAVDSETGIVCTTTEIDFSVQFYDLATGAGFSIFLPGANNQIFSGADVAVDPVSHVFLVAQPVSSTAPSGSSIHVYDESGTLLESLNGFDFSNRFNVIPIHIALNPGRRRGFVDGPDENVTEIQSFTY